jgi:hypothetical protein
MLGTYVRFRVRICVQPSETRESKNTLRDKRTVTARPGYCVVGSGNCCNSFNLPSIPSSLGVLIGRGPDAPSCRSNSIQNRPAATGRFAALRCVRGRYHCEIALTLIALPTDARVPSSTCATLPLSVVLRPNIAPLNERPEAILTMFPPSPAASAARPLATVGTRTVKWTVLISSSQASDGLASKTCFGAKSWATIWKSSTPQRLKRDSRLSFAYRRRSQRTATQQFEIGFGKQPFVIALHGNAGETGFVS